MAISSHKRKSNSKTSKNCSTKSLLKHRDKLTNLVANPKRKLDTNAERNHHNSGMSYATSDLNVIYGDSHHPNHSFVFNEQNFTKESYFKKEQVYEQKLAELREKLAKLKELGTLSNTPPQNVKFLLARLKMSNEAMHAFLNDYVDELRRVEDESRENFSIVKLWFEKQNAEIEQVFQTENRRATNEFLEKRADLKENIRNEYEEMRKQLEIDRTSLDINTDMTEVKPPPTRNLRRRVNQLNPYDFDTGADINPTPMILTSSVSSSMNIGANSCSVVTSINTSLCAAVSMGSGSNLTAFNPYSNAVPAFNSYFANAVPSLPYFANSTATAIVNSTLQSVNDRKRKLTTAAATISFALNEDELNEDFRFLVRNVKKEFTVVSSSPKVSSSSSSSSSNNNNVGVGGE